MASDEEFVRQNEELVDLRFALRRADSELELLRRERNLLRKELVLREAEVERTIALVERTDMIARLEAAEVLAEERLHRIESLENRIGVPPQLQPDAEMVDIVPGGPWPNGEVEVGADIDLEDRETPLDTPIPPGAQLPPGAGPSGGENPESGQDGRSATKKRSRFRADLRQARRTSLP